MAEKNRRKNKRVAQRETVGVILMIVAALFLVCLCTSILSDIGTAVRGVCTGLLGYFAYAFFASMLVLGFCLLRGLKLRVKKKWTILIIACAFVFLCLLQVATSHDLLSLNIGQYLSGVYKHSSAKTSGGILFGIFAAIFSAVLTRTGAYICFSLLLAIGMGLLCFDIVRARKPSAVGRRDYSESRSRFIKSGAEAAPVRPVSNQGLFIGNILPKEDLGREENGTFSALTVREQAEKERENAGAKKLSDYFASIKQEPEVESKRANAHEILFEDKYRLSKDSAERFLSKKNQHTELIREVLDRANQPEMPSKATSAPDIKNELKNEVRLKKSENSIPEVVFPPARESEPRFVDGEIIDAEHFVSEIKAQDTQPFTPAGSFVDKDYNFSSESLRAGAYVPRASGAPDIHSDFDGYSGYGDNYGNFQGGGAGEIINCEEFKAEDDGGKKPIFDRSVYELSQDDKADREPQYSSYFGEPRVEKQAQQPVQANFDESFDEDTEQRVAGEIDSDEVRLAHTTDSVINPNPTTFAAIDTDYNDDVIYNIESNNIENAANFESKTEDIAEDKAETTDDGLAALEFDDKIEYSSREFISPVKEPIFGYDECAEVQFEEEAAQFSLDSKDGKANKADKADKAERIENADEFFDGVNQSEYLDGQDDIQTQTQAQTQNQFYQQENENQQTAQDIQDKNLSQYQYKAETEDDSATDYSGYYIKNEKKPDSTFSQRAANLDKKIDPKNQINIETYMAGAVDAEPQKPRRKRGTRYLPPPAELLTTASTDPEDFAVDYESNAMMLEETLKNLKLPAKVIGITRGPAVTRYELEMPPGYTVKKIEGFSQDIAYSLASAGGIRIEAPIPGKRAVGVEVPNASIGIVSLRELIESQEFAKSTSHLSLCIGKDIAGKPVICSLEKMPHLLIAGSTNSGKSACLHSLIISMLYKSSPAEVRLILIDPKRVEFPFYKNLRHLMINNIINEREHAINAFKWVRDEMEERYRLLAKHNCRNLQEFNACAAVKNGETERLPSIVIIVDELSDLMQGGYKKEMEEHILSIAQKARASGVHLILATQRPSVDVITGTIKINLPSRIALAVSNAVDSKTILDQGGAEMLLGRGDLLFAPVDASEPRRIQGSYVTTGEIESIVQFVNENNPEDFYDEAEQKIMNSREEESGGSDSDDEDEGHDPLLEDIARKVIETNQASTSMIQRRFKLGYARASRIIDQMERYNFIGTMDINRPTKPREVYITRELFKDFFHKDY